MSSADPDEHEQSSPGFFMKSTIKSIALKFSSVKNVSTSQLAKWLKVTEERTVAILDSRPEAEYVVSHLAGARRVDYEEENMQSLVTQLEEQLQGKPNPTIVCYCSVGYRSSAVAKKLQDYYKQTGRHPVPEIYNLSGSLFQWANEGRAMVNNRGEPTKFAHPYTSFWGKLLNSELRNEAL